MSTRNSKLEQYNQIQNFNKKGYKNVCSIKSFAINLCLAKYVANAVNISLEKIPWKTFQ